MSGFVTDQHQNISIKRGECSKRATAGPPTVSIQGASPKCPGQWKKILSSWCKQNEFDSSLIKGVDHQCCCVCPQVV